MHLVNCIYLVKYIHYIFILVYMYKAYSALRYFYCFLLLYWLYILCKMVSRNACGKAGTRLVWRTIQSPLSFKSVGSVFVGKQSSRGIDSAPKAMMPSGAKKPISQPPSTGCSDSETWGELFVNHHKGKWWGGGRENIFYRFFNHWVETQNIFTINEWVVFFQILISHANENTSFWVRFFSIEYYYHIVKLPISLERHYYFTHLA